MKRRSQAQIEADKIPDKEDWLPKKSDKYLINNADLRKSYNHNKWYSENKGNFTKLRTPWILVFEEIKFRNDKAKANNNGQVRRNRQFARSAALFLQNSWYWTNYYSKKKPTEEFIYSNHGKLWIQQYYYQSQIQIEQMTSLTFKEQKSACDFLKSIGVMRTYMWREKKIKHNGGELWVNRKYYHINVRKFKELVEDFEKKS